MGTIDSSIGQQLEKILRKIRLQMDQNLIVFSSSYKNQILVRQFNWSENRTLLRVGTCGIIYVL